MLETLFTYEQNISACKHKCDNLNSDDNPAAVSASHEPETHLARTSHQVPPRPHLYLAPGKSPETDHTRTLHQVNPRDRTTPAPRMRYLS